MILKRPSAVELIAVGPDGRFLERRTVAWVDAEEEAHALAEETGAVQVFHREVRLAVDYKGRTFGKSREPLRAA